MKGVKTRLLGVVLIIVGFMDSMLAWRGGFQVNSFYTLLIASGVLIYCIGAIRRGSKPQD